MPANARAILIEALCDAHRSLDKLLSDPRLTLESIASREGKSEGSIRMTLSLAFLAPDILKAAVEGRLPARWTCGANRNLGNGNLPPETFGKTC
jgi:site-specific DNA recombinase